MKMVLQLPLTSQYHISVCSMYYVYCVEDSEFTFPKLEWSQNVWYQSNLQTFVLRNQWILSFFLFLRGKRSFDQAGVGAEEPGEVKKEDDMFDVYRKRMMLAYRFRPNPLVCVCVYVRVYVSLCV